MSLKKLFIKSLKNIENAFDFSVVEKVVKTLLNKRLEGVLLFHSLNIDTKNKEIKVNFSFYNDNENINIQIKKYNISKNNDFIVIKQIQTGKDWIAGLFKKFVQDKTFPIPPDLRDYFEYLK